jgi:hypothetical protein
VDVTLGSMRLRFIALFGAIFSPSAGLAVLSAAVCVLGFATDPLLPYWIDAERGEVIVLAGFGAGAAVAAGGGPLRALRALLAAVLLAAAIALQFTLIAEIVTYGQRCGTQFNMAVLLAVAVFITWPVQATCVVVVLAVVIYAVSGRIGLRGRAFIVGALLLALGLAVALMPTHTPGHCPDGG